MTPFDLPDSPFVHGVIWGQATEIERWTATLSRRAIPRNSNLTLGQIVGLLVEHGFTTTEYLRRIDEIGDGPVLGFRKLADGGIEPSWVEAS